MSSMYPATVDNGSTNPKIGDPNHPPSAFKGNITSMMGKMSHNPQKQQDGNIMVANSCEQKAARFETKAAQWEQKGDLAKAQKNRDKASRYRQKAITKMHEPLTTPKGVNNQMAGNTQPVYGSNSTATAIGTTPMMAGTTQPLSGRSTACTTCNTPTCAGTCSTTSQSTYVSPLVPMTTAPATAGSIVGLSKSDKAARCDEKALRYEKKGNLMKAQRNREKAWRTREKSGVPQPVGAIPPVGWVPYSSAPISTAPPVSVTSAIPST